MSIISQTSFRRATRTIWHVYRVPLTEPGSKEDSASTRPVDRRKRVATSRTPDGARRAAQRDRRRQEEKDPSGELTWERWGDRLVSDRSGNIAYSIERCDVRRN